jgi:hypothetical protein
VAFLSQLPEVKAPHPEDMDTRVLVENLLFLPKVAIRPAIKDHTHHWMVHFLRFGAVFDLVSKALE